MKTFKNDFHHILRIEAPVGQSIIDLTRDLYTLGRGSKNSIIIHDKEVSRCHATIVKKRNTNSDEDLYWIYDGNLKGKKSTNGLIVNKEYCLKHLLKPKDLIFLGKNVKLTYHHLSSKTVKLLKSLEGNNLINSEVSSRETLTYKQTIIV
ncbi:MAG: FHA domain-containing protein [Prochloraceae cyanobacterium]